MALVPTGYSLEFFAYLGAIPLVGKNLGAPKNYGAFFYRRGFSGQPIQLRAGGDPLVVDAPGDFLPGLKPRKVDFQLLATNTVQLAQFFAADDREMLAVVTQIQGVNNDQGTVYFVGYVTPFDASEPYASAPYPIEFSATDALGTLADFPYLKYPTGIVDPGVDWIGNFIINSLRWVGYELPVWFSMHTVEEAQRLPNGAHPGPWVDPFFINKINSNLWLTDKGEYASCKQVLDNICATFRLRLAQVKGVWQLLCVDELPGLPDINGSTALKRYWNTYTPSASGAGPYQYGQVTEDVGVVVYKLPGQYQPRRGAKVARQAAKPKYRLTFDYGAAPSLLTNGGFIGVAGQVPAGWIRTSPVAGSGFITGDGTIDHPFGVKILGLKNGDPKRAYRSDQQYLNILQQTEYVDLKPGAQNKITVSGQYINYRTKGAAFEVVCTLGYYDNTGTFHEMPIQNGVTGLAGNAFQLQADSSWGAKTQSKTVLFLHFDNIQLDPSGPANGKTMYLAKPTDGESFTITSNAIPYIPFPGTSVPGYISPNAPFPTVARIVVSLWPGPDFDARTHEGAYTIYRNVQFSLGDGAVLDLQKEVLLVQIGTLDARARKRIEDIKLVLGDQTTAYGSPSKPLRPGAVLRADGKTPTRRWMMATPDHAVDKIQNLVVRNSLIMTSIPRTLFDGDLVGEPGVFDILIGQELGGIFMVCLSHKWNVKMRSVTTRAVELAQAAERIEVPVIDGNYETKEGARYPMGDGVTGGDGVLPPPNIPAPRNPDPLGQIRGQLKEGDYVPVSPRFSAEPPTPYVPPGEKGGQYPVFEQIDG